MHVNFHALNSDQLYLLLVILKKGTPYSVVQTKNILPETLYIIMYRLCET